MKLSQGEYVALERIENVYSACPVVQQIYVHGDSSQSYLLAVVIPDPVVLARLASKVWKKPVSETDLRMLNEAVKDEKVVKAVLDMLTKDGARYGLKGHVTPIPSPLYTPCDTSILQVRVRQEVIPHERALLCREQSPHADYESPQEGRSKEVQSRTRLSLRPWGT
jgi:hypothetical protein